MHEHNQSPGDGLLWRYAVAVYDGSGVADACLSLQDAFGLDVNLLLYAAWLASLGQELGVADAERLAILCEPWRTAVIGPLRRQRRAWRGREDRAAEYRAISRLELAAEREQLGRLEGQAPAAAAAGADRSFAARLRANLRAVAAPAEDPACHADLERLARALLAAGAHSAARKPPD